METVNIKSRVVGVDIGVNQSKLAIVDVRGNIIARDFLETTDYHEPSAYVAALSEKIIMMAEANGGYETIRSVGISSPSANFVTGCIEHAANLQWKGIVPLAAMLRDRLEPVALPESSAMRVWCLEAVSVAVAVGAVLRSMLRPVV